MHRYVSLIACISLVVACGNGPAAAVVGASVGDDPPAAETPDNAADAGAAPGVEPGSSVDSDGGPGPFAPADAGPAADASSGTIDFHLLLGVSGSDTPGDTLSLAGDNYTDLIASNYVAGVMYGHLIEKSSPGMLFDKDYLYGSIFGQLLQENLDTELYSQSSDLDRPFAASAGRHGHRAGGALSDQQLRRGHGLRDLQPAGLFAHQLRRCTEEHRLRVRVGGDAVHAGDAPPLSTTSITGRC